MGDFGWGLIVGVTTCLFITIAITVDKPSPIDVYCGKTTLEITYRDSVAIDSTVVYKMK